MLSTIDLADYILAHGLQALGTNLDANQFAIPENLGLLDVGPEFALGMSLGKTDVIPCHRLLTAYLTDCHNITFSC